jgi:hypothetical protein
MKDADLISLSTWKKRNPNDAAEPFLALRAMGYKMASYECNPVDTPRQSAEYTLSIEDVLYRFRDAVYFNRVEDDKTINVVYYRTI